MTGSSALIATDQTCTDPVILDLWHPMAVASETTPGLVHETTLLGTAISCSLSDDGEAIAWRSTPSIPVGSQVDRGAVPEQLPVLSQYGYLWTSLGSPPDRLFETHLPGGLLRLAATGSLPASLMHRLTRIAQKAEEKRSGLARRRLLESEGSIDDLLAFSGSRE